MAQAPNYYYNSPWIADAARNLASALKPPDPQELLQRDRANWMFNREQTLAGRQDQKYQDDQAVEDAFAKMVNPVYDPASGKIDQAATDKAMLGYLSSALEHGGDASTALKLMGTNSPEFAVKEALANLQAQNILARINAQGMQSRETAGFNWDRRDASREDAQDFTAEENSKKRSFESEQNFLKQKARLREIGARAAAKKATGGGGAGWHSPPDNILKEITYGLDDMIRATGRSMSPEARNQFIDRAITRWQKSGNPQNALNEQWANSFPGATSFEDVEHAADIPGGWFSSGTRGGLNPVFVDEPEDTYGGVLTNPDIQVAPPPAQEPAPPPPPTQTRRPPNAPKGASSRGKPPEGTRSKDKKGNPIIYRNGRWEYP